MTTVPDGNGKKSMATLDSVPKTPSKKQQRDAQRAVEFRARKSAERWLPLVQPILRIARRNLRNDTWTAWMRSKMEKPAQEAPREVAQRKLRHLFRRSLLSSASKREVARLKLRNLLWREWTRPQFESRALCPSLALRSYRDQYFLKRVRSLQSRYIYGVPAGTDEKLAEWGWNADFDVYDDAEAFGQEGGFDPNEMQAALAMSLADANSSSARFPGGNRKANMKGQPGSSSAHAAQGSSSARGRRSRKR